MFDAFLSLLCQVHISWEDRVISHINLYFYFRMKFFNVVFDPYIYIITLYGTFGCIHDYLTSTY